MAETGRLNRRGDAVRRAVLAAAIEEIVGVGADAATVQNIARRAGVNQSSVYRRWGTREKLLLEALLERTGVDVPAPDTGSLRGDLLAIATSIAAFVQTPVGRALLRAGAQAPSTDDESLTEFWRARGRALGTVVARAHERRELDPDTDAGLLLEMLVAPLHFRILLSRDPIDPGLPQRLVDQLLRGIRNAH